MDTVTGYVTQADPSACVCLRAEAVVDPIRVSESLRFSRTNMTVRAYKDPIRPQQKTAYTCKHELLRNSARREHNVGHRCSPEKLRHSIDCEFLATHALVRAFSRALNARRLAVQIMSMPLKQCT